MEPAGGGGSSGGGGILRKLFRGGDDDDGLWQDKEIRFDSPVATLELRPGERLIDSITEVEDTKGNNGERGIMLITTLRVIWKSEKSKRTNLSVGLSCIANITVKGSTSRLKGDAQSVFLLTKYNQSRFEFIFTALNASTQEVFNMIQSVHRQFDSTRLYRDLKLRGNIIHDKALTLLPQEELINKVNGAWNLSSEQGNLGTFFITNVRLVWFANLSPNFNVSIPYVQMKSIRVRDSKFGQALVVETTSNSGSYILGFKVDPESKLKETAQELNSLFQVYSSRPIFGFSLEAREGAAAEAAAASSKIPSAIQDDVSIIDAEAGNDVFAAYYADGSNSIDDREPVFSPELGLAIEALHEDITVQQLWSVL